MQRDLLRRFHLRASTLRGRAQRNRVVLQRGQLTERAPAHHRYVLEVDLARGRVAWRRAVEYDCAVRDPGGVAGGVERRGGLHDVTARGSHARIVAVDVALEGGGRGRELRDALLRGVR